MTKYDNKQMSKATFVMEECFFVNCVVTDCDLFYSGGDVEWVNSRFENCRWHFRGLALKTVQLMIQLGMMKPGQLPQVPPAGSSTVN
jgi:hypothetical protein